MSPSSSGSGPDPERTPRRSRAALVVAVLTGALTVGVVLVAWMRGENTPSATAPESVAAAPVAEIANAPEVVATAASEPVASSRPEAVADQVEICEGFWVAADADGKPNQEAFEAKANQALRDALVAARAALSTSASPRDRAASAFLDARDKIQRDACRDPSCARDVDPLNIPIDAGALDRLVQAAQVTDDAQIYAWAYAACRFVARTPACLPIQAAQWARIDPGNAVPWLALAEEARQRKDAPGEADAMFHVGAADRYQSHFGALTAAVIDRVPGGEANTVGGFGAAVYVIGIEAATQPGWSAAISYCGAKELADANRSELCERIAVVLAEHADTALARSMGLSLAKRLGWSTERLRPLTERIDAEAELAAASASPPASSGDDGCRSIQAQFEQIRDLGHYGELAVRERAFDASGSTVAQLAAKHRQRVAAAQRQAEREAAASAAAGDTPASASR